MNELKLTLDSSGLLGCPWCNSRPILMDLCDSNGKYGKGYGCPKGNCCCGPVRKTEKAARMAWNSRQPNDKGEPQPPATGVADRKNV